MESKREAIQAEINALKSLLRDTDYKANKLIEGLVAAMDGATAVNFISRFIAWLADAMREYGDVVSSGRLGARRSTRWRLSWKP